MQSRFGKLAFLFGVAVVSHRTYAQTPSFDCSRAVVPAEKAICSSHSLADADQRLAAAYQVALNTPSADRQVVKQQQLDWIGDRTRRCQPGLPENNTDPQFLACLSTSYDRRIEQLAMPPTSQAACRSIAGSLKAAGDADVSQGLLAVAASAPGSGLVLDDTVGRGYSLESTYVGSLNCQNPHLFRTVMGQQSEIPVPPGFGPGEGAHCGADTVRLVSVNSVPGLLNEVTEGGGTGHSTIAVSLRVQDQWTEECTIDVLTRAIHEVAFQSCSGSSCGPLADLAVLYSNRKHGLISEPPLPTEANLGDKQKADYAALLYAAGVAHVSDSFDLPFVEEEKNVKADQFYSGVCHLSFDGLGGTLFPVIVDGQVLLGKIGTDGFGLGAHSGGPDDVLAIYRLSDGTLDAVAAFCIRAGQTAVTSVKIHAADRDR